MKTKIFIIGALIAVLSVISAIWYINCKTTEDAYVQAIEHIKNGEYASAIENLKIANKESLDEGSYYYGFAYNDESKSYYKNSVVLHAYATAKLKYAEGNNMVYVNSCLECIPEKYSGEFSEEINSFKESFAPEYETFLLEQEKKRKEEFEKAAASYADKLPYEGMSEQYIDYTLMGKHHKYKNEVVGGGMRWETTVQKYYWENIEGDTILYVDCEDGVVKDVIKYGVDYFWTEDGKPIYTAVNPYRHSKKKSTSNKKDDPYNVNDYSDPEDFYDDNYDDFWDYEEAEDYYNSYHD